MPCRRENDAGRSDDAASWRKPAAPAHQPSSSRDAAAPGPRAGWQPEVKPDGGADKPGAWEKAPPRPAAEEPSTSPAPDRPEPPQRGERTERHAPARDEPADRADEPDKWTMNKQAQPPPPERRGPPREGRGEGRGRGRGGRSDDGARRSGGAAAATTPAQPVEPQGPTAEETELEAKLSELRIRVDGGEGDADADDVNEDGQTLTISEALAAGEARLAQLQEERATAASCAPLSVLFCCICCQTQRIDHCETLKARQSCGSGRHAVYLLFGHGVCYEMADTLE